MMTRVEGNSKQRYHENVFFRRSYEDSAQTQVRGNCRLACLRCRFAGVRPDCREAYEILVKSFAPIAVFDKDYDELGPFPKPPTLKAGASVQRKLIVYNDAFSDETVELRWEAVLADKSFAGETRTLKIPLGEHVIVDIAFTPPAAGELRLDLISAKGGKERFRDSRGFVVE
jgi:hypothetical protein